MTDDRPDGTGGPHVFVDDLDSPVLSEDDRHHLERVLRLRAGDRCTIGDGHGGWRRCLFGAELVADPDVPAAVVAAVRTPRITIAFTVVKGDRPERVVAALTELGVDEMVPLTSERSVVRWDQRKAERNRERLNRIARESAMQSRRVWMPEVAPLTSFADFAGTNFTANPSGGEDLQRPHSDSADSGRAELRSADSSVATSGRGARVVVMADPTARHASIAEALHSSGAGALETLASVAVVIGPEGGWTDQERAAVDCQLRLPGRILRAETAAIVSAAVLVAARDLRS